MPLDPQVAAFLERCRLAPDPPIWTVPVEQSRAAVLPVPGPPEPVGRVENLSTGPPGAIPLRVYEPLSSPRGVLLFCHGGGWVTGDLDTHDALCRRLCREAGARVVSVHYRRAPEHPFPAAVEDAYAALLWATEQYPHLPHAVCGDSAGGNLAAALCLMSRDRQGPRIAAQVLIYPVTDCGCDTESYRRNGEGYFLTAAAMRWFWRQYAPHSEQAAHPYASPLRAASLNGLPPAFVLTAEYDILRDEGRAYAARLAREGVPVEVLDCEGLIHAFVRRLHDFDRAADACRAVGAFLKRTAFNLAEGPDVTAAAASFGHRG